MSNPQRTDRRYHIALFVGISLIAACGPADQHGPASTSPDAAAAYSRDSYETGLASWYGPGCVGRPTASGETFRPHAMTAAHRTLPLGSRVRVTNLENGRRVVVQINDRGPFASERILDCSEGAARALGFRRAGLASIAISLPRGVERRDVDGGDLWLHLGAFGRQREARDLQQRLEARRMPVTMLQDGAYLRVLCGPYNGRRRAEKALRKLEKAGFHGYALRIDRLEDAAPRQPSGGRSAG